MTPVPNQQTKRVAIVGGASTRKLAPYKDPTWEIWAFSSKRVHTPRITRWFEMHALGDLRDQLRRDTPRRYSYSSYMRFLRSLQAPIYMHRTHPSIPGSVRYPIETALKEFGRCFTSTASYLIALAIMEGFATIGVWGVHLTEKTVYARQRPAVEYLLGVAKQKGIEVVIPPESPLTVRDHPIMVKTEVLYGYDWRRPGAWWRPRRRVKRQEKRRVRTQRSRPRRPRRTLTR